MKYQSFVFAVLSVAAVVFAQEQPTAAPKSKFVSVIGEVTAVTPDAKQLSLKTDAGAAATILLGEATHYLRVPPGEKDLKKAARIELSEIGVGDRVLARVRASDDQPTVPAAVAANSVIVMKQSELAAHHQRNREEWQKRSTAGRVSAVNTESKEITIQVQAATGLKTVTVEPSDQTVYRRYAAGTVRFSDATSSTFAELKKGDNLRVLGEKSEDGTHIKAEEIISGTFRNFPGTIITISPSTSEVVLNDLETKKPVTVKINPDSTLKRLPPQMAAMMARMRQGGGTGAPGTGPGGGGAGGQAGPGGGAAAGGPRMGPGFQGGPAGPGSPDGAPGPGAGGGMRMRGGDFQQMLEHLPGLTLAELKPGDAVIIASTAGTDPFKVTAISLLAGVEPLLTASPKGGQTIPMGSWDMGMTMPQ